MRILSWSCRGLPQLKESIRLFKPELIFICETKRKKGFVSTVCKKMGLGDRWYVVDPIGKSGGLLLEQGTDVTIFQIITTAFSMEIEFETPEIEGKMWAIFVYASNKERIRAEQQQDLLAKKGYWCNKWVLRGNFNDIRNPDEKRVEEPELTLVAKDLESLLRKWV